MSALETLIFRSQPIRFWDGQEAENELKVPWEPLKHRRLDFTQFAFCRDQQEESAC